MFETSGDGLTISCDECSMQCTPTCRDCLVTFLMSDADGAVDEPMVLDLDQIRVVRLLGQAGMVPDLKYRVAG